MNMTPLANKWNHTWIEINLGRIFSQGYRQYSKTGTPSPLHRTEHGNDIIWYYCRWNSINVPEPLWVHSEITQSSACRGKEVNECRKHTVLAQCWMAMDLQCPCQGIMETLMWMTASWFRARLNAEHRPIVAKTFLFCFLKEMSQIWIFMQISWLFNIRYLFKLSIKHCLD